MSSTDCIQRHFKKMKNDIVIRREDIPKILCLYKEIENYKGNPEVVNPGTSKGRESSDYTSSDEEIDVLNNSDDENSMCVNSISKDCNNIQKSKSTSSCTHISEEVKNSKRNLKTVKQGTSRAEENSDDEVDVLTYSDNENANCEKSKNKKCNDSQLTRSSSSSSLTVHVCTHGDCDKFFSRPSRLEQHLRTHTGERPFVCPSESCSRSYTRQQHLSRHIQTSHQDERPDERLECVMCKKMMSNAWNLKKHVLRIHSYRRYQCSECDQSFTKQQHLQTHTYVHTGIPPYPCNYPGCEMRFMNPSKRKGHQLIHQKSRYVCPQESCQQKFDTYRDMQQHIAAAHPKVCDICSRPFKHLRHLKKHRLTHENTTEAYFCTYEACNKFYYHLRNLTSHIKDKHQQQKIYGCGVCDKRLCTKQKLIHHMTTHSASYKRSYTSEKLRKPRKDKGCIRRDLASLLSGYNGNGEEESLTETAQQVTTPEDNTDASTSGEAPLNL